MYGWCCVTSAVLVRLRPSKQHAVREVNEIIATIAEEARLADESFRFGDLIRTPALRRILFLGSMMQAIQQLSGINTVMYYSGTIVVMAGMSHGASTQNFLPLHGTPGPITYPPLSYWVSGAIHTQVYYDSKLTAQYSIHS